MLPSKDLKPFAVKFPAGGTTGSSPKKIYTEWQNCSGLIKENVNARLEMYGKEFDCDIVIKMNANDTSRKIGYGTVFLVGEMPTKAMENGNFYVKEVLPEYNGEIQVLLNRREGLSYPRIYYEANGEIMEYQLNFNNESLVGYVPKNSVLPFNKNTKIWYKIKPSSADDTNNRISLVSEINIGLVNWYNNFKKLTFKVVDNG